MKKTHSMVSERSGAFSPGFKKINSDWVFLEVVCFMLPENRYWGRGQSSSLLLSYLHNPALIEAVTLNCLWSGRVSLKTALNGVSSFSPCRVPDRLGLSIKNTIRTALKKTGLLRLIHTISCLYLPPFILLFLIFSFCFTARQVFWRINHWSPPALVHVINESRKSR